MPYALTQTAGLAGSLYWPHRTGVSACEISSARLAPKHGGLIRHANDVTYELVPLPQGAQIYVEDHGKPVSTATMLGKLTVLQGVVKSEAVLKPGGPNRLDAAGVKIAKGARVLAVINVPGRKAPVIVRYQVP
jgi:hypothetical protein